MTTTSRFSAFLLAVMTGLVGACGRSPAPQPSAPAPPIHLSSGSVAGRPSEAIATPSSVPHEQIPLQASAAWHFLSPQCIRRRDGAWCWGPGAPKRKPELDGVVAIARAQYEYYLLADGKIRASERPVADPREDAPPPDPPPNDAFWAKLPKIEQLVGNSSGSIGMRGVDGTVWALHDNYVGGTNEIAPRFVRTLKQVPVQGGAIAIAAGDSFFVVTRAGKIMAWNMDDGDLEVHAVFERRPPAIVNVFTDSGVECFLTLEGTVACAGDNSHGLLGDGTRTKRYELRAVSSLPTVRQLYLSYKAACAVTTDGRVYWWGSEEPGGHMPAVPPPYLPQLIDSLHDVREVAVAWDHMCVLLKDESVACRGHNGKGELGDGTTETHYSPIALKFE